MSAEGAGSAGTVNWSVWQTLPQPGHLTSYIPAAQFTGISISVGERLFQKYLPPSVPPVTNGSIDIPSFSTVKAELILGVLGIKLLIVACRVLPVDDVLLRYAVTVRVGGVVSSKVIVIVKLAVPTFPAASVAIHVTVVVPTGNNEPDAGIQGGPETTPTLSDTKAVNSIILPAGLEVEFVIVD